MLDTQKIGQLTCAVDQIPGQRCEKVEETVFLRSETKTHGEAPVIGNMATPMVDPRTPLHTNGCSPPRRPGVIQPSDSRPSCQTRRLSRPLSDPLRGCLLY